MKVQKAPKRESRRDLVQSLLGADGADAAPAEEKNDSPMRSRAVSRLESGAWVSG